MPYKRIQGNIQTQVTRSQQVLHFFNLLIVSFCMPVIFARSILNCIFVFF